MTDNADLIANIDRLRRGIDQDLNHLDDVAQQLFNAAEQLVAAVTKLRPTEGTP